MPQKTVLGTSPIQSTAMMPTKQMMVVPRSDWKMKMMATGRRTPTAQRRARSSKLISELRYWESRRAMTSTMAAFANSDGWKLTGPKTIQRLAPKPTVPMRAVSSSKMTTTLHTAKSRRSSQRT